MTINNLSTAVLSAVLTGCATSIVPPPSPLEPVEIFVVDHGRTSSLVIPASDDDGMRRYAYGDWNYYALGKADIWHGLAALFWPTQGALGRTHLKGPASAQSVRVQTVSIQVLHAIAVERTRVQEFERAMESLYRSCDSAEVENRTAGLRFVPHPRPYTYLWNSNHAVASWLRELGVSTGGTSFRAEWRVLRSH